VRSFALPPVRAAARVALGIGLAVLALLWFSGWLVWG